MKTFFQILRRIGIPLFIVVVIGNTLDDLLTSKIQLLLLDPHGTSPMVWVYGAFSFVLNLLDPLLIFLLVAAALQAQESVWSFIRRHAELTFLEQLRAWGNTLVWSFALLLPGLIRFFQYLFVPFVVCFDAAYARGERDALKTSRGLAKGRWFALFGVVVLFGVAIPALLTGFDEYKLLWRTPISALGLCFVEMAANICFILGLWKLYQRSLAYVSKTDEPHN